ncbi:BRCT domain-containing protein [Spartinivicinus poritis]|uniref:BRCT domain-containing protein n=1 Tax=Spartinivicinus poritis TaxID=2994640 RepID=A0ABT5U7R8_9GAMM|nr:BRCT domain-containing protein [Spartinivicinus sp. A2-2]MDE1462427.1 BRCT domain-containing protein [Spartinivicinus sp. A2-2]
MSLRLTLDQLHRALQVSDPQLVRLIIQLSQQIEIPEKPIRQGADTFDSFIAEISTSVFRKKPKEEQWALRVERIKALEVADAEVPLTECLKLHQILFALYEKNDAFSRWCLLAVFPEIELTYGPWRALKAIFKQAEADNDTIIYGALAARFDQALASGHFKINRSTLVYLTRRAWRYLRRKGEQLPACYPDTACDVLAHYTDDTHWSRTWIANHIFYHENGQYNRNRFTFRSRPSTLLKYRAFTDSWRLTPRPLFALLEQAQAEQVRRYATTALKTDFRASLREVEPQWISRLVGNQSATIDDFVIWVLDNVPRFEQTAFKTLGLHDSVLALFNSPSDNARVYAATYARTHARDLSIPSLIRLIDNSNETVRQLAFDLIQSHEPRKGIGLDNWGAILETHYGYQFAESVLLKHFSKRELTPGWYQQRLLQPSSNGFDFAVKHLTQHHSNKSLGALYFSQLLEMLDYQQQRARKTIRFACEALTEFDLNSLPTDFLKATLINPKTQRYIAHWVDQGLLSPKSLELTFLKAIAFHPSWEQDAWLTALKQSKPWAKELTYSQELAETIFSWLADIRHFTPEQLSFDWLMTLVERSEPLYHDFAVDVMNRAFLPADFAPDTGEQQPSKVATSAETEINVDFGGDSFLFTGKLAKMTRSEAKNKVTTAGGSNASGVTKKLKWLVIGDEGSPLYGEGRKGSKQVKAESLIEEGAELKIISETAFLQMLADEQREFSDDAIEAGCNRLWEMITTPGKEDAPLTLFALSYIRHHHPDICLKETDRPVDPGAEIPADFLSFERVQPLFNDNRVNIRAFALELAHWEFARWQPPIENIVALCESPYKPVRGFIAKALTADATPEHKRYRLDPDILTPDAVYSFCEAADQSARKLGMVLIEKHPRLQLPQELFRLTESPDRSVRGFVIQRFWHWYRDRGITQGWKPQLSSVATLGAIAKQQAEADQQNLGAGAPVKPTALPADHDSLEQFLRRILLEIAPGRLAKNSSPSKTAKTSKKKGNGEMINKLKPLPTRKAKLNLIETLRDIAVADSDFARYVLPLLQEFKGSRGKSEHAACLVAVTRITAKHPELSVLTTPKMSAQLKGNEQ